MQRLKTDILVIGAGSGGLSVAAGAVQMGARVILLEGGEMGGDCLNHGCVPSKALLAAAAMARAPAKGFGIAAGPPRVDYGAVMDHVRATIDTIAPVDSQDRFEALGVQVIREFGRFLSSTVVQAGDHVITARRIVIATGSAPLVPPIPGLERVNFLTNETLWTLRERPDHLLIIGAGPIGLEMAQAHVRLGSRVTVVEADRALARDDPEAAALVAERLRAEGVEIVEGSPVSGIASGEDGSIHLATGDGQVFRGSHLLVAVGRKSNTDGLNLQQAGIKTTKTAIRVDAGLRSTNRRVFAIGDVAGGQQFTHLAGYHASVILRPMLFGLPATARTSHIPRATYTDPELAQIGPTEAEARASHGDRLEIARFDFAHNDRAITQRKTEGFVKVMVHRGRPLGATIVGHQAGELAGFWSLAIAQRLKMGQLASMVTPYPTIAEVNKRAVGAYFTPRLFENPNVKRAVGLVQRWLP